MVYLGSVSIGNDSVLFVLADIVLDPYRLAIGSPSGLLRPFAEVVTLYRRACNLDISFHDVMLLDPRRMSSGETEWIPLVGMGEARQGVLRVGHAPAEPTHPAHCDQAFAVPVQLLDLPPHPFGQRIGQRGLVMNAQ